MSYYIEILKSDLVIPNDNKQMVLTRWKELNDSHYNYQKRGGNSDPVNPQYWYSGMPSDYDKTSKSAEDIIELLRFNYRVVENGDIEITKFNGKAGQEELFFRAIADLVPSGKLVQWLGEDGEKQVWYFDGHQLKVSTTLEALDIPDEQISQNVSNPFKKTKKYNL